MPWAGGGATSRDRACCPDGRSRARSSMNRRRLQTEIVGFRFNAESCSHCIRARSRGSRVRSSRLRVGASDAGRSHRRSHRTGWQRYVQLRARPNGERTSCRTCSRAAIDRQRLAASARLRVDVSTRGEAEPVRGGCERNRRVQIVVETAGRPAPRPPAPPQRRRRRGDRGPGLAKEFVIIAGAPSNFYNGFGRINWSGTLVLNPAPEDLIGVNPKAMPSPIGGSWITYVKPIVIRATP